MSVRIAIISGAAIIAAATLGASVASDPFAARFYWMRLTAPPMQTTPDPPELNVKRVEVTASDDLGKPGMLRSVMVQAEFSQAPRTSGVSPESIYVEFDEMVTIVGVLVSVDVGSDIDLAEVAVAVNDRRGYSLSRDADWLIHTSYASHAATAGGGKIDESMWFGGNGGFVVRPRDHVAVGAWLQNRDAKRTAAVSPEVILYYLRCSPSVCLPAFSTVSTAAEN